MRKLCFVYYQTKINILKLLITSEINIIIAAEEDFSTAAITAIFMFYRNIAYIFFRSHKDILHFLLVHFQMLSL